MKNPVSSLVSVKILGFTRQSTCFGKSSQICASSDMTTEGHPVVMGSKTFRSIGRPLPHRENIILSRQEIDSPDIKVFHD